MTTITTINIELYRLLSLKMQLKLESKGMKSSGGAIRPRIANEFGLKPRDLHIVYIAAIDKRIEELRK